MIVKLCSVTAVRIGKSYSSGRNNSTFSHSTSGKDPGRKSDSNSRSHNLDQNKRQHARYRKQKFRKQKTGKLNRHYGKSERNPNDDREDSHQQEEQRPFLILADIPIVLRRGTQRRPRDDSHFEEKRPLVKYHGKSADRQTAAFKEGAFFVTSRHGMWTVFLNKF